MLPEIGDYQVTIQLASTRFGESKVKLQATLNSHPDWVRFDDPSPFNDSRGNFSAVNVKLGEKFAVVMDPATRRRFATVRRLEDGSFKVS